MMVWLKKLAERSKNAGIDVAGTDSSPAICEAYGPGAVSSTLGKDVVSYHHSLTPGVSEFSV